MHGLQLFILTLMEISAFLILWSALSIKPNLKGILKLTALTVIIPFITVTTDYYKIACSGVLNYLITFVALQLLYKKPIKQAVTYYIVSIAVCICIQVTIVFILQNISFISKDIHSFANAFKINIVFISVNLLIAFILPFEKICRYLDEEFGIVSFVTANAALYAIILKTAWDFNKSFFMDKFLSLVLISVLLILSNLIFLKYSVKIGEQKKIIETYNKYSPIITKLIEETRRKQHDFKNHLNTIYGIAQVASDSELRSQITQYIHSLNYELKELDLLIQINNKVLSGIIYSKLCHAREQGIEFEFSIKSDLAGSPLEDYKLSEMLNNLLDNAFEAACTTEYKKVVLTIDREENRYVVEVKNSGKPIKPENISKLFERGFTSKASNTHGYGLYNVKKIVDSVNGRIELSYDDNRYIVFRILF